MKHTYRIITAVAIAAVLVTVISASYAIGKKACKNEIVPVAPPQTYQIEVVAEEETVTEIEEPVLISLGTFKVTHYCPCEKCCGKSDGITATGTQAVQGRTIAVDPSVIPYGTKVLLKYDDGTEEDYIAEDCGGAIQGNTVDVFMGQHRAAVYAGVRTADVFFLGDAR